MATSPTPVLDKALAAFGIGPTFANEIATLDLLAFNVQNAIALNQNPATAASKLATRIATIRRAFNTLPEDSEPIGSAPTLASMDGAGGFATVSDTISFATVAAASAPVSAAVTADGAANIETPVEMIEKLESEFKTLEAALTPSFATISPSLAPVSSPPADDDEAGPQS